MAVISIEDLRQELQEFAKTTLRSELSRCTKNLLELLEQNVKCRTNGDVEEVQIFQEDKIEVVPLPGIMPEFEAVLPLSEDGKESSGLMFEERRSVNQMVDFVELGVDEGCAKERGSNHQVQLLAVPEDSRPGGADGEDFYESTGLSAFVNRYETLKYEKQAWHSIVHGHEAPEELHETGYYKRAKARSLTKLAGQGKISLLNEVMNTPHVVDATWDEESFPNSTRIARIVQSHRFEYCVMFFIICNAILLAIEIDTTSRTVDGTRLEAFKYLELLMLLIFTIELGLRIYVFGWSFFKNQTKFEAKKHSHFWNFMDCFIVGTGLILWIIQESYSTQASRVIANASILRVLRILRVTYVVRVGKLLRVVAELRRIIHSLYASLELWAWGCLLFYISNFVFSAYFTELVSAERSKGNPIDPEIEKFFPSLMEAQRTLFAVTSGGVDWLDVYLCLKRQLGVPLGCMPLILYLLFEFLCLANVFSGVFVDQASKSGQQATELQLLQNAVEVFKAVDGDSDGRISKEEFEAAASHPDMEQFFHLIELDVEQASTVFILLDTSHDGTVNCDEFLSGCMRLRGTAKALDLLILSHEVTQLFDGIAAIAKANAVAHRKGQESLKQGQAKNRQLLQHLVTRDV